MVTSLEIVQSNYEKVFDSVNAISNAKNLEDKYKFQIEQLENMVKTLREEKIEQDQATIQIIKARDILQLELKDLVEAKQRIEREKTMHFL